MPKQIHLPGFQSKNFKNAYGGDLMKTRKGREGARPLSTKHTMHLVLRSTKATKDWSFLKKQNAHEVHRLSRKFATKYGVKILSLANVGNHLHYHIRLSNRHTYEKFIRALTASIAMAVTGRSRWTLKKVGLDGIDKGVDSNLLKTGTAKKIKFWDYRPFTRIVTGFRAFLNLRDYIKLNQLEGFGYSRRQARFLVGWDRARWSG